jgi:hypothetical protein
MGFADVALSEVIQGKLTYEHATGVLQEVVFPRITTVAEFRVDKQAA